MQHSHDFEKKYILNDRENNRINDLLLKRHLTPKMI